MIYCELLSFKPPLSFVLQGSDFLQKWFDNGREFRIPFMQIPEESISFTYGDSMTVLRKDGMFYMVTKSQLLEKIGKCETGLSGFLKTIEKIYHYIEVQLWDDECCKLGLYAGEYRR